MEAKLASSALRISLALLPAMLLSTPSQADRADEYIRAQMQAQRIPGLSIAVMRDGKVIKSRGYGYSNLELNAPATTETVYELGSVTKQFVATGILLLREEGKLGLDDRVGKYLAVAPPTWDGITLRQLLWMTSGVKDYINDSLAPGVAPLAQTRAFPREDVGADKIIEAVAAAPLSFVPGEQFSYSNSGYIILARVITEVSGQEWDRYLAARIFEPLGMSQTRRNAEREVIAHRASRYDVVGGSQRPEWRNSLWLNPTYWWNGGAGIVSSVRDMAKWDAALRAGRICNSECQKLLRTPGYLAGGSETDYGMGWFLAPYNGHTRMSHDGGIPGGSSNFTRFDDARLSIVAAANSPADLQVIVNDVAGLLEPAFAHPTLLLDAKASARDRDLTILIDARNFGRSAEGFMKLELRKAPFGRGDIVSDQTSPLLSFAPGKPLRHAFNWTALEAGEYRAYIGTFSKDWAQMYSWKNGAATVEVP